MIVRYTLAHARWMYRRTLHALLCLSLLAPFGMVQAAPKPRAVDVPAPFAAPASVVDLNPTPTLSSMVDASDFIGTADLLYMTARSEVGRELWRSDGTSEDTRLIKDIFPGTPSSAPADLVDIAGRVYFTADDGTNGRELWRSNGNTTGTVLIGDVAPGNATSSPRDVTAVGNTIYFTADDGTSGRELWRTDGTAGSAGRVADIMAGPNGSEPSFLTAVGTTLYFVADDGTSGRELWCTDGTAAGTVLVADIVAGLPGSNPHTLIAFEDALFFVTDDNRLWRSRGTAATTEVIAVLSAAAQRVAVSAMVAGDYAYFTVDEKTLWQTQGDADSTRQVRQHVESISEPTAVGTTLFYLSGGVIWHTNGTDEQSLPLTAEGTRSYDLTNFGGRLYFAGNIAADGDGDTVGVELWRSDGTPEGTTLVVDFTPSYDCQEQEQGPVRCTPQSTFPGELTATTDRLFFVTNYVGADAPTPGMYTDFYATDGTAQGTIRIVLPPYRITASSSIDQAFDANGVFTVLAENPDGNEDLRTKILWQARGGVENTGSALPYDFSLYGLVSRHSNGDIYLSGEQKDGARGIWILSPNGNLRLVKAGKFSQSLFYEIDGIMYFDAGNYPYGGAAQWRSDGTEAGTYQLDTVTANPCLANISSEQTIYKGNGLFYCSLGIGARGDAFWRIDGTKAGTMVLATLGAETMQTQVENLQEINGLMYFTVQVSGTLLHEVWRSDGTQAGTFRLGSYGIDDFVDISRLERLGSNVVYVVGKRSGERTLWLTDGTVAGTRTLYSYSVEPETNPTLSYLNMASLDDRVFFVASDGERGSELWETNGTVEGTRMLKDINPGAASSSPTNITTVGDRLLFSADDGVHGAEPWISDGTTEGTTLVQDLYSGVDGSTPGTFKRSGNHLYFIADHPLYGRELWSIPYRIEIRSRVYLPLVRQSAR